MNTWLVGSGIPRRTLCANCAAPMSWLPKAGLGEEIAAELDVSAATLYNWRRTYGGMDTDAAKELKELRVQNGRLKRLLAEAELEARYGGGQEILSRCQPAPWSSTHVGALACKAVGWPSTYQPADGGPC